MDRVGFWWEPSSWLIDSLLFVYSHGLSSGYPLLRALVLPNLGSTLIISLTLITSLNNYQRRLRFMDNESQPGHNSPIKFLPGHPKRFDLNTLNFHISQWACKKISVTHPRTRKLSVNQVKFCYPIEKGYWE